MSSYDKKKKVFASNDGSYLSHPTYRPDVDGLRAVAVLAVVFYHAFPDVLKGGFVGVDIFFVISGFLISTVIINSLERGSFRFADFYARRVRRIFPALAIVLVSCLVFGWIALLAGEYEQLGKHIAAGATFFSNFTLWSESSYFDNSAETKPLLHLWSLGIEEQFYLIWPILLLFLFKKNINLFAIAILLTFLSFIINIFTYINYPIANFYSPLSRFWELLAGSILALLVLNKDIYLERVKNWCQKSIFSLFWGDAQGRIYFAREVASVLGALLIGASVALISKEDRFPGFWAVLPVFGATLTILAGPRAFLNRYLLTNRIMVWVGLISFPLYLWHWPLLSFARIIENEAPSFAIRCVAVFASVILAGLTYLIIERPLRFGGFAASKAIGLTVLIAAIGYVGYEINAREGLPFRRNASPEVLYKGDVGHLEFHKYPFAAFYTCTPKQVADEALQWEGYVRCLQSKKDRDVDIVLLGDSHAEHLFIGLAEALPDKNIAFYIKNGAPFIDNEDYGSIFKTVSSSKTIKKVIVTMYWAWRISQIPLGQALEDKILETTGVLLESGKELYITDDVPSFPFDPDKCRLKRFLSTKQNCEIDIKNVNYQLSAFKPALERVVKKDPRVKLLETSKFFCNKTVCKMTNGEDILYRDTNHLNIKGSQFLGRKFVESYPIFN
ncbi:acyltransferase family protein [Microvirga sp. 2MCAF38]|uniref:acyltransferase family protein n=1 Tax=Microvirga sp. 2MCAF38 TaxID=3232989 RepID=UPI003F9C5F0A